ncbi:MAG TPA: fumarylacetoacetate hydrolase family protein [Enhygromyxa sp.]|nr:fumarylacetoacetate hydrolase family protein [Enhygromyxa sp.]
MNTLWLARILGDDRRPLTLRTRTDGEAPGPDACWEPIADPFATASFEGGDPATLAATAAALGPARALLDQRLLPPIHPQKIIGIGRNYKAHAEELGNEVPTTPLTFFKPTSCLLVSGDALELPRGYQRIDMEAELVVVIGRRARKLAAERAWEHVAGYLLGNDVSCRDLQQSDKQWTRAKGFDGFGPVSPFLRLVEPGWALPVEQLEIRGYLNDERVQTGACELMIFSIPTLIEHLSACMTLEPGDLIFTGTPAGVSPLAPGNVVRVELGGLDLGRLVTPVT